MNSFVEIPALLRQLRDDTAELVREEVALAKTEISEKAARTGRNVAYLAVGALIGSSALLLLLIAVSYLLAEIFARQGMDAGTAVFAGFLIVAVLAGIASAVIVTKAAKDLGGHSIKPDRTVQSLRENKQWAQSKMS